MKKRVMFIILIVMLTLCTVALSGCNIPVDKGEVPIKWDSYISDIADSYYETFKLANGLYSMSLDFQLKHIVNDKLTTYNGTFKITQDTYSPNLSAVEIDVYSASEGQDSQQIFYFAANNRNTYIYAKDILNDYDIKYQFENTPIFSLYSIDLSDPTIINATARKNLKQIAKACTINADKSVYTLDFDLRDFMITNQSDINKIFDIIPSPIIKEINEIFNTNVAKWQDVLKDTVGKSDIILNTSKRIDKIRVYDMQSFASAESMIKEMTISNIKVTTLFTSIDRKLCDKIELNKDDYPKTKIGTLSAEGTLELVDSSAKRTAVTYDYKFNSSIDLLALAANGFDFSTLDDNNYLHIRISHKCNSNCSAFCSVNYGNKLEEGKGAIIDIAFSPKDFGTKFIYVSLGVKQLLSKSTINEIAGASAGLANLVLPQYVLLTIDSSAYAMQNEQNNGLMLIKFLMGLNTNLSIYDDYIDVDINKMLGLAGMERNAFLNSMLNLGGYNVDTARINYFQPQFGVPTDYDIYREAIHLIDYNYSDTKDYSSDIFSTDPSLNWDFNDYTQVNDGGKSINVHNIYFGDGTLMYSDSIPISAQELTSLKGGYINYKYTNIFKESQDSALNDLKGKAKILDITGVDKSIENKYQSVSIKVALPSKWLGIIQMEPLESTANEYLYAYVKVNIKLTPMAVNGMVIKRTDMENGSLKTNYEVESQKALKDIHMLDGVAIINYTDNKIKEVKLTGSCSAVVSNIGLLTNSFSIISSGAQTIKFHYAGKSIEFLVNILQPENMTFKKKLGHDTVFRKNEELSYLDFVTYEGEHDSQTKPKKYGFDFRNHYIYGKPMSEGSNYWDTYLDANGETIVKFKVDGTYSVEIRAFGYKFSYDIKITSNVIDKSTYAIIANNSGSLTAVNSKLVRSYYIKNRFHGVSGLDNLALSVEVYKGSVTVSGTIIYKDKLIAGDDTYSIENMKYKGKPYDPLVPISLPPTIFSAIPMWFELYIKTPGYYRLTIKLGSIVLHDYLTAIANEQ